MASQVPGYETVYGIQFFDDIHNYLPELLYNPGRFESVPQLLFYIQRQTMTRFNLFQQGRNAYYQQAMSDFGMGGVPSPMAAAAAAAHQQTFRTSPIFTGMRGTTPAAGAPVPAAAAVHHDRAYEDAILLSPLLSLLRAMNTPLTATFRTTLGGGAVGRTAFEDIPVRPTRMQIQAASRVLNGPPPTTPSSGAATAAGPICAICQDSIQHTDVCRELLYCSHLFHRVCIDQWLQQNVRCPVCRHDIRELPAATDTVPTHQSATTHPLTQSETAPSE